MKLPAKIRVLIVDDSPLVRRLLQIALQGELDIEVVATAPDPYVARDLILELAPDVVTLDIEMPRMDGISFLKRLMRFRPTPVIIISSLGQSGCEATLEALRLGAIDVLGKPSGPNSVGDLASILPAKIRAAAAVPMNLVLPGAELDRSPRLIPGNRGKYPPGHLVAIGASTGGTRAIEALLASFEEHCPATVIAQHIPAGFSAAFAARLQKLFPFHVREARDGDLAQTGEVLIAPGNLHMLVEREGAQYRVAVRPGPLVCYQRPSVDVLFESVAKAAAAHAVGVILTGMGNDGAKGLRRMFDAGAWTIAQDEATSIVFGMPREAIAAGSVRQILPLSRIAAQILQRLDTSTQSGGVSAKRIDSYKNPEKNPLA